MPRCTHCGKVNREGSLFCQDCGHRLEPAVPAPVAKPAAAVGAGMTCSSCGTVNPPGMNFCKMCGTSLMAKAAPAAPLASASTVAVDSGPILAAAPVQPAAAKAICPACGKGTPVGFAFCQHCGQRLGAQAPGVAPASVRNAPA